MKKILTVLLLILIIGCTREKTRNLASQVYETEEKKEFNRERRLKELTKEIKKLEDELEEVMEKYRKVGTMHRTLGVKLMHYKMYLKAYEHFDIAVEFYPNSEMLHYYRGIAAGQYAISSDRDNIKRDYLERARKSYEYSLKINPRFPKSLYALSILYVYEYDRPEDAKPLLDDLLDISTREFDAMLLRALLYEKDGELNAALDLYDKVISLSKKDSQLVIAETNRDKVLKRITGD